MATQGKYAVIDTTLSITDSTPIPGLNGRQGDSGRIVYFALKDGRLPHNLDGQDVTLEVKDGVSKTPISQLTAGKEYLFNIRVLTSKNLEDVKPDAISFFEAVDIEQSMDDFIKAYWLYPSKIRFQLTEAEEP